MDTLFPRGYYLAEKASRYIDRHAAKRVFQEQCEERHLAVMASGFLKLGPVSHLAL